MAQSVVGKWLKRPRKTEIWERIFETESEVGRQMWFQIDLLCERQNRLNVPLEIKRI